MQTLSKGFGDHDIFYSVGMLKKKKTMQMISVNLLTILIRMMRQLWILLNKPVKLLVPDEVCNDEEYEKANSSNEEKSICSVDIYPLKYNLDGLERFRSEIEEYFKKRKDVIEKVIKCEFVNFGNNVNLGGIGLIMYHRGLEYNFFANMF